MNDPSPQSRQRPWAARPIPDAVRRIPCMLSDEEMQYLSWVTSEAFEGFGAVVDLGPWLGASTAALAHGLKERGIDQRVLAYDLFEWRRHYMVKHVDDVTAARFEEGDSFLSLFEEQTREYGPWIEGRPGSLLDTGWDEGPIEILFVDAAKDWALTNAILRAFAPSLVPGRSRVISQDFRIHAAYWLPYVFDGHPEQWREVEQVRRGSTVTFLPRREWVSTEFRDEDLDFRRAEPIFRARIASAADENKIHYANSLFRIAILRGERDAAERLRPELESLGAKDPNAESPGDVEAAARAQLLRGGWAALAEGDRDRALRSAQLAAQDAAATDEADYLGALVRGDAVSSAGELPAHLRLTGASSLLGAGQDERAVREILCALHHRSAPPRGSQLRYAFEALESAWQRVPPTDPLGLLAQLEPRCGETPAFHLLLALVHNHLGDVEAARSSLARVLGLDPRHERARQMRGMLRGR